MLLRQWGCCQFFKPFLFGISNLKQELEILELDLLGTWELRNFGTWSLRNALIDPIDPIQLAHYHVGCVTCYFISMGQKSQDM